MTSDIKEIFIKSRQTALHVIRGIESVSEPCAFLFGRFSQILLTKFRISQRQKIGVALNMASNAHFNQSAKYSCHFSEKEFCFCLKVKHSYLNLYTRLYIRVSFGRAVVLADR